MKRTITEELGPDSVLEAAEKRKEALEHVVLLCEKYLQTAPEGSLKICMKGKAAQYYHRLTPSDRKGKYLKRAQDPLAWKLAKKEYYIRLLREVGKELDLLRKLTAGYHPEKLAELYSRLSDARKHLITPVILPDDLYAEKWQAMQYEGKTFDENAPEYYTSKGERVRSKSEIMIADALARHHIPYHYEYPLPVGSSFTFHPDFTCLNVRTREVYYWEHNGMMSDEMYADHAVRKLEQYMLSGYFPGKNLILTFESETRPLNTRVIENCIRTYLE